MAEQTIAEKVASSATAAVVNVAAKESNTLNKTDIAEARPEIKEAITKAVEANPEFQHVTNTEPWFQSRVTLGAISAIGSGAFGFYAAWQAGIRDWEILSPFIVAVLGGLGTIYGRWVASKPLGR